MFNKITTTITQYFWAIFLWAIVLWLIFPSEFSWTYSLLTPLIIALMYLGSLDIEYDKLSSLVQNRKDIVRYYIIMMLILPIVLFYVTKFISYDVALWVFVLAAAPAGIASVAFTRLMWGNTLLSLCIAVITTVSLPFVLPILSTIIIDNDIRIDAMWMFIDLLLFCILPILAAYLTQRFLPQIKTIIRPHTDRVSIIMIGLMIVWPVAYNAHIFLSISLFKLILIVWWLFILSAIIHTVGWLCFSGSAKENKIAWSLGKWFMNISIATVIAAKYFGPEALLIVMLYEFPWDLMLIPFKWFVKKIWK